MEAECGCDIVILMTTITLKSKVPLSITEFRDFEELRKLMNEDEVFEIKLERVPKSKITPKLRALMREAQKIPKSKMLNI